MTSYPKPSTHVFTTNTQEISWVCEQIQSKISEGIDPGQIAVIARKHSTLQQTVPIFNFYNIPISYERGQNVLKSPHILQIITILKFIQSFGNKQNLESQDLLPEILRYPFWHIPSLTIYQISLEAYKNKETWLQTMLSWEDSEIQDLAAFFIELGKKSSVYTAEQILDEILGVNKEEYLPENEFEDSEKHITSSISKYDPKNGIVNKINSSDIQTQKAIVEYISPYKWYYFDSNLETSKSDYFTFLSELKVFISAIRKYKTKEVLSIFDVLEYVELMEVSRLSLLDHSSFNRQKDSVCLLTAHKAKGLEFEHVFVISCIKKEWNGKGVANKVGLPTNLSLLPEGENTNDALRLFYVALTRAKNELYLTSHKTSEDGSDTTELSFLVGTEEHFEIKNEGDEVKSQTLSLQIWLKSNIKSRQLSAEEKSYLKPILENYKLSVTHLNNFLDISSGGPQKFLEQNLLRFPQSKRPDSGYGTAMHLTMSIFQQEFAKTLTLPSLEFLLLKYEDCLKIERLNKKDFENYLIRGKTNLSAYFEHAKNNFNPQDQVEQDFAYEGVQIGNATITGKIDKLKIKKTNQAIQDIVVVDLKTGKATDKWDTSDSKEKIKLDRYRRQLVFYKILVENSRTFGGKSIVNEGVLEFLEASKKDGKIKSLGKSITKEETEELVKLIEIVFERIQNMQFSPSKEYSQDFEGNQEFINDLLSGTY